MIQGTYLLKSHSDQVRLDIFLNQHRDSAYADGQPLVVRVSQKQEDRSLAQNRLYWKWLKQWSDHQGTDKDSEHFFFKKKFLIGIYNRDDPEFAEMCRAIKTLKANEQEEYEAIANHVIKLTSTRNATTAQFTEYLNDIHAFCLKHGCYLEVPDDLKWVIN